MTAQPPSPEPSIVEEVAKLTARQMRNSALSAIAGLRKGEEK